MDGRDAGARGYPSRPVRCFSQFHLRPCTNLLPALVGSEVGHVGVTTDIPVNTNVRRVDRTIGQYVGGSSAKAGRRRGGGRPMGFLSATSEWTEANC